MTTAFGRVGRHVDTGALFRPAWPLIKRRRRQAALRARLHLASGERVLSRACAAGNATAVATDRALYWSSSGSAWRRLGWEEIGHLGTERGGGRVIAICWLPHGTARTELPIDRRLLAVARERVAASRIVVTRISIDGHDIPVEGRRQPATGRLRWLVRLGDELDPNDPALPAKIDSALAELRSTLGV